MKEDKKISISQVRDASLYVEGYFKLMGLRYPYDMPDDNEPIPKEWPDDVKAAVETMRAFDAQVEEEDIII